MIDEKLRAKYSQLTFNRIFFIKNVLENKLENDNTIENFNFDNDAVILFTSGSSGEPKAVVHTFKSLYESVKAIDLFANLSQKDIWLASLPHYHIGGFMIFIRSLLAGSALAFPNSLNYEDFMNAYTKHEPTYISLVVTTLKKMLNDNISVNKKLKYIFLGGGPIATDLCVDAINKGFPIIKVYGSTETCSMITALHPLEFKLKPNSSGLPLDKSKIKIKIKNEYKKRIGEVLVKSPTLFKEYLNDESLTKEKYYDSFYNTGDYGWIDNDGYLFIEARREDIIITGGENVSIKEIENAFSNINGIKEFHIFSLKDEKWGQSINAVVVKGIPDITDDEIKSVLKTKLASFKIPKRIFFLEVIPKTELGKVNKNELLKLLKLNSSLVF